jgi:GNAT superfamily N-acetyltransferase
MPIEIRELHEGDKKVLRDFLDVVDDIYRNSPAYVRPLDFDVSDRLNKKKNPFFEHAEATAWVAYRDGRPVGRCTAQVDQEHIKRYHDGAGMFGFLDTIDDAEVAKALLDQAAAWVKARGMTRLRGPLSLSINEELGCLTEGFDKPPMILMTYHNPYQAGLIEQAGFTKLKEFYAWKYDVGEVPPRAQKAHDEIAAMPEVTTRPANPKRLLDGVRLIMDIFNDAWSDNWGFVPFTQAEINHASKAFGPVIIPDLVIFVEVDDEAAAFIVALANLNEAIEDFNGRLDPINLVKLLWRLKIAGVGSTRVPLMGVRKKYRNHPLLGAGLAMMAIDQLRQNGKRLGKTTAELGWILEDNKATNNIIRSVGGVHYKTHRIYQKALV